MADSRHWISVSLPTNPSPTWRLQGQARAPLCARCSARAGQNWEGRLVDGLRVDEIDGDELRDEPLESMNPAQVFSDGGLLDKPKKAGPNGRWTRIWRPSTTSGASAATATCPYPPSSWTTNPGVSTTTRPLGIHYPEIATPNFNRERHIPLGYRELGIPDRRLLLPKVFSPLISPAFLISLGLHNSRICSISR